MSISSPAPEPHQSGTYESFRYDIINPESNTAVVKIHIPAEQKVKAIPGCMMATSSNVEIAGKLKKSMKAILGPDDARYQTFKPKDAEGWVQLAPPFFGAIRAIHINNEEICVGDDAFLASFGDIESTSVRQGMKKAFFSGHGLFIKKIKGSGVVFVCGVGSMMHIDLGAGEEIVVDTGHLVSWPRDIKYDVQKASKRWSSTGMSGEGMVSMITGPGRIYIQTRSAEEIAEWTYDSKAPPAR